MFKHLDCSMQSSPCTSLASLHANKMVAASNTQIVCFWPYFLAAKADQEVPSKAQ